jgi:hypothetical protein
VRIHNSVISRPKWRRLIEERSKLARRNSVIFEKRRVLQALKEFQHIIETQCLLLYPEDATVILILNRMNPVHIFQSYFLKVHFTIMIPSISVFIVCVSIKILYPFPFDFIYATCSVRLILFDLIIVLVFGEEFELKSSTTRNYLSPPLIFRPGSPWLQLRAVR